MKIIKFYSTLTLALLLASSLIAQKQPVQAVNVNNDANLQSVHIKEFRVNDSAPVVEKSVFSKNDNAHLRNSDENSFTIDLDNVGRQLKAPANAQEIGDEVLSESFSAYNNNNDDPSWLPSEWTRQTKNTSPGKTWYMNSPKENAPFIPYVDADKTKESDEWMITPQLSLGVSNDLLFYLYLTPGEMYYKDNQGYHKDQTLATFQVMVLPEGKTEWEIAFDAAKELNFTNEELSLVIFQQVRVHLSKYASKKVKLGFRYIGKGGGDMGLDEVFVGTIYPEASYLRPKGTYYNGLQYDQIGLKLAAGFFVPAYTDLQFINNSKYCESFSWEGLTLNGVPYLNSNAFMPTFSVTPEPADLPYLDVSLDDKTDTYAYEYYDNRYLKAGHIGSAMNVDIRYGINLNKFSDGSYMFGTCNYTAKDATENSFSFEGVANFFEAPAKKATIPSMSIFLGELSGPADTELTLSAMKVVNNGNNFELLSKGTLKISDAVTVSSNIKMLDFQFEDVLFVDGPMLYMLEGFNVPGVKLGVLSNDYPTPDESNAFILLKYTDLNQYRLRYAAELLGQNYSLLFVPNVAFPVLHTDKTSVPCLNQAGTTSVNYETTYAGTDYFRVGFVDEATGMNADWVRLKKVTFDTQNVATKYSFIMTLDLEYDALPDGRLGRSAKMYVDEMGADGSIVRITQGATSGIEQVTIPAPSWVNSGTTFELTYSNFDKVEIYSVSGQRLAQVQLPANGKYSLDHSKLSSGIYLLRFSGNNGFQTIKVTK